MSAWETIDSAPRGREIVLYFPEQEGRNRLPSMRRIDFYPPAYPRQPTHWFELPPDPPKT